MLLAGRQAFISYVYRSAGCRSQLALQSAWIAQLVLLAGRGLSIGELARMTSRPYRGFRIITKWVLALTACILLALEANLRITAAAVVVLLVVLVSRYEICLPASEKLIAAGLLTVSLAQMANQSVSERWLQSYFLGWNIVRATSFHVSLIVWLIALARSPSTQAEQHEALDTSGRRDFMCQGTAFAWCFA